MTPVKDITQKFMLLTFSTGVWTARKRDDLVSNDIITSKQAQKDSGSFTKVLSMHWSVKQAHSAFRAIRKYHNMVTLPWNRVQNQSIIPAKNFDEYIKQLEGLTTQCEIAVDDIFLNWDKILEQAQKDLGLMHLPADYPTAEEAKAKFYINIKPGLIPDTDNILVEVSKNAAADLKKNIDDQNLESVNFAMEKLWDRLEAPVKAMAEKLTDPNANFHSSLIGNLLEVTGALKDLNITKNKDVEKVITEIEDNLCVYTPKELREDSDAREETAKLAKDLMEKMSGLQATPTAQHV